jgi:TRAP transporter TAXI family solute receptor
MSNVNRNIPAIAILDRRTFLKAGGALGAMTVAGLPSIAFADDTIYRWGSASLGSSGYVIMEALSQIVKAKAGLNSSSLATAGTTENMALIGGGELEFGHSTTVDWVAATEGQKPFEGPIELHQMFAYAAWHEPPIVHADSDIRTVADLAGKRYSPSQPGSGAALLHHELMRAAGIYDSIDWAYGTWAEVYDAFKARRIHGVVGVITNGQLDGRILEAEAAVEVRALEVPEEVILAARQVNAGILDGMIGPDVWPTLEKPIRMPLIGGVVAASPNVTPEAGYAITSAIFDNAEEVRQMAQPLSAIDTEFAVRNMMTAFPVNAGAAQYFQEQGVWRDDLMIAG